LKKCPEIHQVCSWFDHWPLHPPQPVNTSADIISQKRDVPAKKVMLVA